jgi:hypothetical protein
MKCDYCGRGTAFGNETCAGCGAPLMTFDTANDDFIEPGVTSSYGTIPVKL